MQNKRGSSLYRWSYKTLQNYHRRKVLKRSIIEGLGAGRSGRTGRCLLSYIPNFINHICEKHGKSLWDSDQIREVCLQSARKSFFDTPQHWQSGELVRQLIERGYIVDCIYDRDGYLLEDVTKYDLIIDEWNNLDRWAQNNPRSKKWYYALTCHWLVWNSAELERLKWLFHRRGISYPAVRQLPPMLGLDSADVISYVGSDFIAGSFGRYSQKLMRVYPNPLVEIQEMPMKEWDYAKRKFIFFGSSGWVHRGLDLVIEAFLQTDLELYICTSDDKFLNVYGKELVAKPQIKYMGFVDPSSSIFRDIAGSSATVVYPSAAEGCSYSMVQCMHFGLIPLVTEAVGLGIHNIVPPLRGKTDQELIQTIIDRCNLIASMDNRQLEATSLEIWKYATTYHTYEGYSSSIASVLDKLHDS